MSASQFGLTARTYDKAALDKWTAKNARARQEYREHAFTTSCPPNHDCTYRRTPR